MANISIKLNLKQLKHIEKELPGKDGKKVKCLIIPVVENRIFEGEKGSYLDITAIEIKNKTGDSKDTHLLKQNFAKEIYEAMSEEEKRAEPILGNAILWARGEQEPVQSQNLPELNDEDFDDLPF